MIMPVSELLQRLFGPPPSQHTTFIIGTSVATTLAVLAVARLALQYPPPQTIPSPRVTQLPHMSIEEQAALPYPPDVFPGARDVGSPYGTVRVYEWGPVEGRKVLLVHGISTPCLSLGGVAAGLVERGCRVMLVDLWGRGYSDSVDLPHDSRLYTTEILLAITSSPLAWTPGGFSLIGYSLGGGISADFAVSFPDMIKSLVLLAPSGLIRSSHFGWQSRVMYSSVVPESFLQWVVRRRLKSPIINRDHQKEESTATVTAESAVSEEIRGTRDSGFEGAVLMKTRPEVTVKSAVQWQLENHEGFVPSFVSSIKHSSIEGKNETWKKLGTRDDKVIIIAGNSDPLIVAAELEIDAKEAIGAAKVDFITIVGGHEFPITCADEVVQTLGGIWDI